MNPLRIHVGPETTEHLNQTVKGGQLLVLSMFIHMEHGWGATREQIDRAIRDMADALLSRLDNTIYNEPPLNGIKFYPLQYEIQDTESIGFPYMEIKKPGV